jgi:hypothetical protein
VARLRRTPTFDPDYIPAVTTRRRVAFMLWTLPVVSRARDHLSAGITPVYSARSLEWDAESMHAGFSDSLRHSRSTPSNAFSCDPPNYSG